MLLNSQLKSASDQSAPTSGQALPAPAGKHAPQTVIVTLEPQHRPAPLAVLLNGSWIVLKQSSRKGLSQFFSLGSFRSDWIDLLETVSKPFRGLQSPTLVRQHLIRPEL